MYDAVMAKLKQCRKIYMLLEGKKGKSFFFSFLNLIRYLKCTVFSFSLKELDKIITRFSEKKKKMHVASQTTNVQIFAVVEANSFCCSNSK